MKISEIKKRIVLILKQNKVKKAGIFGSYAKGKQKKNSDVDILIEVSDSLSLLELVKIKMALEKRLMKKVDLVEYCCIHPLIKKQVLKEEVKIYA